MGIKNGDLAKINHVARQVRDMLEKKYGGDDYFALMGKCIEASDNIVSMLSKMKIKSEAKQVWCLYEYFENCTDYCFEEHWIVVAYSGSKKIYVDVTMSQFQWAFHKELPRIYIGYTLPKFFLTRKPGKTTLDKCGWDDWLKYGDYINNFDYWGDK